MEKDKWSALSPQNKKVVGLNACVWVSSGALASCHSCLPVTLHKMKPVLEMGDCGFGGDIQMQPFLLSKLS